MWVRYAEEANALVQSSFPLSLQTTSTENGLNIALSHHTIFSSSDGKLFLLGGQDATGQWQDKIYLFWEDVRAFKVVNGFTMGHGAAFPAAAAISAQFLPKCWKYSRVDELAASGLS